MRRLFLFLLTISALLSGCASMIKSEVTAFHQWPSALIEKTFAFQPVDAQAQNLEYRNYENLVRHELLRLGMTEVAANARPRLHVRLATSISGRDVRIVETVLVDPWYGTPWMGPGYYGPYWGRPGFGPSLYGSMWYGPPVAREQERRYTIFHRELKVTIADAGNGQPVYEVTVKSDGKEGNLAKVMPYMVASAFADFPGKSGVPREVDLKMKD